VSEVTLQVGGRGYTVSCADGEETHVQHLAAIVDGKLAAMSGNRAPGDAKNLLFAALILADEAEEARRATGQAAGAGQSAAPDNVARGLEALADRLESLAATLETAAGDA